MQAGLARHRQGTAARDPITGRLLRPPAQIHRDCDPHRVAQSAVPLPESPPEEEPENITASSKLAKESRLRGKRAIESFDHFTNWCTRTHHDMHTHTHGENRTRYRHDHVLACSHLLPASQPTRRHCPTPVQNHHDDALRELQRAHAKGTVDELVRVTALYLSGCFVAIICLVVWAAADW